MPATCLSCFWTSKELPPVLNECPNCHKRHTMSVSTDEQMAEASFRRPDPFPDPAHPFDAALDHMLRGGAIVIEFPSRAPDPIAKVQEEVRRARLDGIIRGMEEARAMNSECGEDPTLDNMLALKIAEYRRIQA